MGFSQQEYWSGLSFPPPGDLPNPGNEPMSPSLAEGFFTTEPPGKPLLYSKRDFCKVYPHFLYVNLCVYTHMVATLIHSSQTGFLKHLFS